MSATENINTETPEMNVFKSTLQQVQVFLDGSKQRLWLQVLEVLSL